MGGLIDSALSSTQHLQPTSHHSSLCTAMVNILILFFLLVFRLKFFCLPLFKLLTWYLVTVHKWRFVKSRLKVTYSVFLLRYMMIYLIANAGQNSWNINYILMNLFLFLFTLKLLKGWCFVQSEELLFQPNRHCYQVNGQW